jgi:hypothetical protein
MRIALALRFPSSFRSTACTEPSVRMAEGRASADRLRNVPNADGLKRSGRLRQPDNAHGHRDLRVVDFRWVYRSTRRTIVDGRSAPRASSNVAGGVESKSHTFYVALFAQRHKWSDSEEPA